MEQVAPSVSGNVGKALLLTFSCRLMLRWRAFVNASVSSLATREAARMSRRGVWHGLKYAPGRL